MKLLLSLTTLFAASTHAAIVKHNSIPVWPEPVPSNDAQALAVLFKPTLNVVNGCQPYPAVDADGNTSGGLKTTGPSNGDCNDKSKAQVYGRAGFYKDAYAIMYAWFMPKDSPSPGLGHRFDWENAVVWLDSNDNATAKIIAIAASAHGDYKKSYPPNANYVADVRTSKIEYKSTWPMNHALGFTSTLGRKQPLIQWEQLTQAARDALETTDFGSGTVPFKSNFETYLAKAYFK